MLACNDNHYGAIEITVQNSSETRQLSAAIPMTLYVAAMPMWTSHKNTKQDFAVYVMLHRVHFIASSSRTQHA
jgi:hypothetical protein